MLAAMPERRMRGIPITTAKALASRPEISAAGNNGTLVSMRNGGRPVMKSGFSPGQQVCQAVA